MAILYKGSPLLKGKHFIYEGEKLTYTGKVFGRYIGFTDSKGTQLVFTEEELNKMKPYYMLKEHSLLSEQDNKEDLYQLITSYTDKQLNIIDGPSSKLWSGLQDSFQEELNKLSDLGLSYQTSNTKIDGESYLLEVIMDYLQDVQRNISDTSLPNHYTQLSNFIYNIKRLKGGK